MNLMKDMWLVKMMKSEDEQVEGSSHQESKQFSKPATSYSLKNKQINLKDRKLSYC